MIGDFFEIKKASCDAWLFISKLEFLSNWWLQRESNQRHRDFQSLALPTELWSHLAVSTGLEPAIFCVTGRRVNQLHHETTWLRGEDLNLWPLGYEPNELPNCSTPRYNYINKNGGGKGIRTPAPLAWPPGFQDRSLQPDLGIPPRWCLRPDLNRHEGWFSQDFKSCASTNSATQARWWPVGDSNSRPFD